MSDSSNEDEPWRWHYKLIRQLYEKANQNEQEISKRNKALEQATATFCAQLDTLPATLAASVERKLQTGFADAERKLEAAASAAGDRIVHRFTGTPTG
jgi:cell division septum initiation protein DivIVA